MRTAEKPTPGSKTRSISIGNPIFVCQTDDVPIVTLKHWAAISGVHAVIVVIRGEIFFTAEKRVARPVDNIRRFDRAALVKNTVKIVITEPMIFRIGVPSLNFRIGERPHVIVCSPRAAATRVIAACVIRNLSRINVISSGFNTDITRIRYKFAACRAVKHAQGYLAHARDKSFLLWGCLHRRCAPGFGHIVHRFQFHERQKIVHPAAGLQFSEAAVGVSHPSRPPTAGGKMPHRRNMRLRPLAHLSEIVLARHAPRGFPRRLNGGQQQRYQYADNGDHHQQFDQRKAPITSCDCFHDENPLKNSRIVLIRENDDVWLGCCRCSRNRNTA